jgi:fimbrial chaperone protein
MAAVCAAAVLLSPALNVGAAIEIMPVRIEMAPGQTTAMTLRNTGPRPVPVQADSFTWSQSAGDDRLEPARDLIVVPPIFVLEAGAQQIVRIAHTGGKGPAEQTYRVVFSELPPPQPEDAPSGISVRLKLSIPVFVVSNARAKPRMQMDGFQQDAAGAVLGLVNNGTAHAKVTGLTLHIVEGEPQDVRLVAYLLPGTRRDLRFPVTDGHRIHAVTVRLEGRDALEYLVQ